MAVRRSGRHRCREAPSRWVPPHGVSLKVSKKRSAQGRPDLILGFAAFTLETIEKGVIALARALRTAMRKPRDPQAAGHVGIADSNSSLHLSVYSFSGRFANMAAAVVLAASGALPPAFVSMLLGTAGILPSGFAFAGCRPSHQVS